MNQTTTKNKTPKELDKLEDLTISQKFDHLADLYAQKVFTTLIPLTCLFKLNGKPYDLSKHFQFEPLFKLRKAKRTILKCARQVGKSQNIIGSNLITSWCIPFFRSLFVSPRFEQAKRLSNDVARDMVNNSPFKNTMLDKQCEESIQERSFTNGSKQYYSFAFLDAERSRGIALIANLNIDETQDIRYDFLDVLENTMAAVTDFDGGYLTFSGTPKTIDNTLTELWNDSSQAEWVVKCQHCGHFNIACPEEDLLKMIGEETCVCGKCQKPLQCETGTFIHRFENRRADFEGYHVSQVIHPLHYNYPAKWVELRNKQRRYPTYRFYNEILGVEYDSTEKLMTLGQLQKACRPETGGVTRGNTLEEALELRRNLHICSMGIDWSGGGGDGTANPSYTSITIAGDILGSDHVQVIYGLKLPRGMSPWQETQYILELFKTFTPSVIAHDYGGAGAIRETLLLQAGIPLEKIFPCTYVCSSDDAIVKYNKPTQGFRSSYSLDKSRSIMVLCTMIKAGKVSFPSWDTIQNYKVSNFEESLLQDFLYIHEDYIERPRGSAIVLIGTTPKKSDDFVHSTNYACSSIWYINQRYPNLAEALNIKLTIEDIQRIDPGLAGQNYFWGNQPN